MRILDINTWFNRTTILSQAEINTRLAKVLRFEVYENYALWIMSIGYIGMAMYYMLSRQPVTFGILVGIVALTLVSWIIFMMIFYGLTRLFAQFQLTKDIWLLSTDVNIYTIIKWQTTSLTTASVEQNTEYCYRMQRIVNTHPEIKAYARRVLDAERELTVGDYIICTQWEKDLDQIAIDDRNKRANLEHCKDLYAALVSDK